MVESGDSGCRKMRDQLWPVRFWRRDESAEASPCQSHAIQSSILPKDSFKSRHQMHTIFFSKAMKQNRNIPKQFSYTLQLALEAQA
jgi:hypothetical protein